MRIAIGADHAGFALKEHLVATLERLGQMSTIAGLHPITRSTIRPICAEVARAVAERRADRGIVLGGSGQGEQMAANKIRGIRAALCNDLYMARMSREHNDANVLAMGGRIVAFSLADEICDALARHAVRGRPPRAAHRPDPRFGTRVTAPHVFR